MPETQTARNAANVIRAFEQREPDYPSTRYDDPDRAKHSEDRDYYAMANYRREGGVRTPDAAELLSREGFTPSAASKAIREAVDHGFLLRIGHGSSTCYRTPERQRELDEAAQHESDRLMQVGYRAEAHGLVVAYHFNLRYGSSVVGSHEAERLLEDGHLVTRLGLAMGVEQLVDLLDGVTPARRGH